MRFSKIFGALSFLLFLSFSAKAQKTINGVISDSQTGKALPSANILIENTYRGTISNVDGHYTLTIPDSLLPATITVRYIGYQSEQRTITQNDDTQQNFTLTPSVTELQEIVVTDEDPGMRIMREVIKRKQQWRRELQTYQADAYTRQTLANDTSIASISESVSEVFWDKQKGHREVVKSKRQTANIQETSNFAGVSYLPNFYDDNIEIAGFKLVGITHPDALDYYHYKLVDQTSLNGQTVFEIQVEPARKLQPLFKGTAYVLDVDYALLEIDLRPNDVVSFPRPVKSFTTAYKQQFNNFGQQFWLPVDVRIQGDIKVSMVGLNFPMINFKQISRITNYKVNTELPDSLYKKSDTFSVDSTAIDSNSFINPNFETIPLSEDEEEAYATIDSTASLEDAFKPSGFLARFVEEDDDEQSGGGTFQFLNKIPGQFSPLLRYNRVEEVFAGLDYDIDIVSGLNLRLRGGYGTGQKMWNYGGGLSLDLLNSTSVDLTAGAGYYDKVKTRYDSHIYTPFYTSIPNLFGSSGYFDYMHSRDIRSYLKLEEHAHDLSFEAGFNSEKHSSLSAVTAYDLIGEKNNGRLNPAIEEGLMNSINLVAGYNLDEGYNYGVTGQKSIRFEVEYSSDDIGSDFNFWRYSTQGFWSFPTFYQRRLMPNTLDINFSAGTYSGDLPFQKNGIVDVSLGHTSTFGTLKAAQGRPYEGKSYFSLIAEHNFRTIPFELIGLRPLVERNIGLILFGGVARTWPNYVSTPESSYLPRTTNGTHWEAGVSLNSILGLFRVDFATRLDEPAFQINIGIARLF